MHSKVWDEITYPLPIFNGCIVEVWKWRSYSLSRFIIDVITDIAGIKVKTMTVKEFSDLYSAFILISNLIIAVPTVFSTKLLWLSMVSNLLSWLDDVMQNGQQDLIKSRGNLSVNYACIYWECFLSRDDVIKWKHFPRYWPFVPEFPSQMPVTRSFDVFFDLGMNKRLSKQSKRRWFETPWYSSWRHCYAFQGPSRVPSWTDTAVVLSV